jgi:hypothetical protein
MKENEKIESRDGAGETFCYRAMPRRQACVRTLGFLSADKTALSHCCAKEVAA